MDVFQFVFLLLYLTFIEIPSSAIGLKICAIISGIQKYKSTIKKTKKKYDKVTFLAKTKLNSIEVLISKAFIDPNIRWWIILYHKLSWWIWFNKKSTKKINDIRKRNLKFHDLNSQSKILVYLYTIPYYCL